MTCWLSRRGGWRARGRACAVVSASPSASCGRCEGRPSAGARRPRGCTSPGSPSPRWHAEHPPEQRRVDHAPRQPKPAHEGAGRGRPAPPRRGAPPVCGLERARERRQRLGRGRRASRSAARSPWISTDAGGRRVARPDEARCTAPAGEHRAASTGTAAKEMTSSRLGSRPGGLHVHHDEARGSRQEARLTAARRPSSSAEPRWTSPPARNASLSEVRVSGARLLGSIRSSGTPPARSCSTWCSMRRARRSARRRRAAWRRPRARACRRPSAASRRAARGGRATPRDQSGPACERLDRQQPAALDVEHPLRSPLDWSTNWRRKPGGRALGERGGRPAASACRSRSGRAANAAAILSGHGGRAPDRIALHHHREQHQAAIAVGLLDPCARGLLPALDGAREQRAGGHGALVVGRQTARAEVRRAPAPPPSASRARNPSSSSGPSQASGAVHVRARERLEARRSCPSPARCRARAAGPSSSCASSISRRVTRVMDAEMARQIAAAGRPASCSAITASGSSAAAASHGGTSAARAIGARSRNGARRSLAIRSTSSSTPTQAPAGVEHRQVADAVVEHLEQRLGARAVGRRPSRRARSSPRDSGVLRGPPRRPPPGRGCRGR